MSRVANNPVSIPSGVEVKVNGQRVDVKGSKGQIGMDVHQHVEVVQEDDQIKVAACAGGKAAAASE